MPTWAIANVTAALVFWVYIISPALYYSNVWNSAYLPIQSNSVFDNTGKTYNVSKVVNKANGFQLDAAKYENYSTVSYYIISSLLRSNQALDLPTHHVCAQSVWACFLDYCGYLYLARVGEERSTLGCDLKDEVHSPHTCCKAGTRANLL